MAVLCNNIFLLKCNLYIYIFFIFFYGMILKFPQLGRVEIVNLTDGPWKRHSRSRGIYVYDQGNIVQAEMFGNCGCHFTAFKARSEITWDTLWEKLGKNANFVIIFTSHTRRECTVKSYLRCVPQTFGFWFFKNSLKSGILKAILNREGFRKEYYQN